MRIRSLLAVLFISFIYCHDDYANETITMSTVTIKNITNLIYEINTNLEFTASDIEKNMCTEGLKKSERSNQYFDVYECNCSNLGWLNRLDLRLPVKSSSSKNRFMSLGINEDNKITQKVIIQQYGDSYSLAVPNPAQPTDSPIYLSYKMPWGEMRFGFSRATNETLTDVVFDIEIQK